ncbi:Heat shock ATP-dependent protease [Mycoplasmopsis agalactiae 14628]|uniref:endopeptidase La n=1 Tax=Mycoplasmopsis agalactiae 14628 TaxID=1110504 RepID=I5D6M9_MYCAA|nr:Heat shock ATP-dependent protease [Mycoplasmopsis agalactiae 14628]
MLFDREVAKLEITEELITQSNYWKKIIDEYTKDNSNGAEIINKSRIMLVYYRPAEDSSVILESELQSKPKATYADVLENINISNLDSNMTLCQVESVEKVYDNDSQKWHYIATLKAIHKYILQDIYGDEEIISSSNIDIEKLPLRYIEGMVATRFGSENNSDEMALADPSLDFNGFEDVINTLIYDRNWNDAMLLYRYIRGYSAEEIRNWTKGASEMMPDFINDDESRLEALVRALTGFFLLPPYELFTIYSMPSALHQFEALKSNFVLMARLIKKFIDELTLSNNNKLLNIYNALTDNELFKNSMEQIKENSELEVQFNYEVERIYKWHKEYLQLGYITEDDLKLILSLVEQNQTSLSKRTTKKDTSTMKDQIDKELNKKIQSNLDKQQKEFLLREKMKAIKEQLNETDDEDGDDEYSKIVNDPVLKQMYPEWIIKSIKTERDKLKNMMSSSPDANITQTYISNLKKLPWRKVEVENLDINRAREILDKNHYGLKEVKERVIEYLSLIINHRNINKELSEKDLIKIDDHNQIDLQLFKENTKNKAQKQFNNVPILTLVGPPGTGKTSLARSIAEALDKSYVKLSLGGLHDESEIRGHRKTYVGAMPGKIIKGIQSAGVSNPLILLDEIDKMSSDIKGDPTSAMLEVLDPEQNTKFQDNYIEHEYDLSKVLFIATANYYENIPAPLLDRVEIIELNSYTINEKIKIAKEHLVEVVLAQAGLKPDQFIIDDKALEFIIKHYTAEAGVRSLKRNLDKIARKIVTKIVSGEKIDKFVIDQSNIPELLGTPKISESEKEMQPQIGSVNGLAFTSIGGTTLQIEVSWFKSKQPGIRLTGQLKEVMQESAKIALSYVRANAEKFGIKNVDFDTTEIHVHVPEGAVPKDGPSAGVTFTTALISALAKIPVSQEVAMTGEITLRGKVLEIGGLKEKSFAAFKKGIKTVFIPKNNEKNLSDIPEEVKEAINFIPVSHYEQIWEHLFKGKKYEESDSESKKKKQSK